MNMVEWLPPFVSFSSLLWFLAILYLVIAVGLWYTKAWAWWFYFLLQLAGIVLSILTSSWLAALFNLLIIGYLWLSRKGFHVAPERVFKGHFTGEENCEAMLWGLTRRLPNERRSKDYHDLRLGHTDNSHSNKRLHQWCRLQTQ